jgi:hypothetical protein
MPISADYGAPATPHSGSLVGPLGLEPRTKGFTSAPPFPEGVDYLFTRGGYAVGAGRSSLSLSALVALR